MGLRLAGLGISVLLALSPTGCGIEPNSDGLEDGLGVIDRPDRPQDSCGLMLRATIRDFEASHPDFQRAVGSYKGLVETKLGEDGIPVYAPSGSTRVTEGREAFSQWYRDIPGVNQRFYVDLPLTQKADGSVLFDDNAFFPIDGRGFGDTRVNSRTTHNYHFTTELHTVFRYVGGEEFTFRGDDDVWVFVNGHLVIDLGGVHPPQGKTVHFDDVAEAAGLEIGNEYTFDIFHAERHTTQSSFRFETSACFRPDADGDGVTADLDCNDNDANVGALLYTTSFDDDDGYYQAGSKLTDPWSHAGGAVSNTRGGQQALLGAPETWKNTVTVARLRAHGLERKCRNCGYRGWDPQGADGERSPGLVLDTADGELALSFDEDMVFRVLSDEERGAFYGTATDAAGHAYRVSLIFSLLQDDSGSDRSWFALSEGGVEALDHSFSATLAPGALLEVGASTRDHGDSYRGVMAFAHGGGWSGTLSFDAAERDRFRIGLLARAQADEDQDEGFHGYRCAVARNSLVDCYRPGRFVQLATFMDAEEDDLQSECDQDCVANTTFDELRRVERTLGTDMLAGDAAELAFWVVDDQLSCDFTGTDGERVVARATDHSFTEGGSGLSVLNALSDFEEVWVCGALAMPEIAGTD